MKLNLGAGGVRTAGWIHVDRAGEGLSVPPFDLRDGLPFADEAFTVVAAHHVLDLLEFDEMMRLLREVRRVLVPGGVLRVSNADVERAVMAAADGRRDWFAMLAPSPDVPLVDVLTQYLTLGGARRQLLTPRRFREYCYRSGFGLSAICSFGETRVEGAQELDSRCDESFYIEAHA